MLKVVLPLVISSSTILVYDGLYINALAECAAYDQGIYSTITSKIESSVTAIPNKLSCAEVMEINNYSPDDMLITSGRKRGSYTICLSNNSSKPCKYVVGTFTQNRSPAEMLTNLFNIPKPKQTQLNETVERLFFKPSLLID
jgi:hypothetical protein